jgi:hypothetical protein
MVRLENSASDQALCRGVKESQRMWLIYRLGVDSVRVVKNTPKATAKRSQTKSIITPALVKQATETYLAYRQAYNTSNRLNIAIIPVLAGMIAIAKGGATEIVLPETWQVTENGQVVDTRTVWFPGGSPIANQVKSKMNTANTIAMTMGLGNLLAKCAPGIQGETEKIWTRTSGTATLVAK